MSTITALVGGDGITTANSMTKINTNFLNLNTDKIETSYLDTDTTLAANSDTKIATQKAVKAYVDTGGNINASETTRGIVEEATDAEVTAGTATGATGAKLFITPAKLSTRLSAYTFLTTNSGATTKNIADADATNTIAHGLGAIPKLVRISAKYNDSTNYVSLMESNYSNSTQSSNYVYFNLEPTLNVGSGNTARIFKDNATYTTVTITVDSTNISLAWAKTGSPTGSAYIIWEAIR